MVTNNNDMAVQIAALQATVADQQDQLDYLFKQFGPVRWQHVLKQRAANAKAAGTKPAFNRADFVYKPMPVGEKQQ
jgi:uncharacterized coiled-coil protein SlyX